MDSKIGRYKKVAKEIGTVLHLETDPILMMSTISALLKSSFPEFLWVGFYRRTNQNELSIGPYQGKYGCLHIKFGNGVCGLCALQRKTVIVPDVSKFQNYIACDSSTKSEIAVPVFDSKENLIAVLDIDSNKLTDFDTIDKQYLEKIMRIFRESSSRVTG
ncbi:MAG: GAF domain-containing protein [Candidatus Cloacimonadia bacterium]